MLVIVTCFLLTVLGEAVVVVVVVDASVVLLVVEFVCAEEGWSRKNPANKTRAKR